MGLKNLGAGMPDGGLFTADQFKRGSAEPVAPQAQALGVIEVRGIGLALSKLVGGEQVARGVIDFAVTRPADLQSPP